MEIGIGLPNTLTSGASLVAEWAKRAEDRGFAFLATIDRVVYPSAESLLSLAVAAGATSRIGLLTDIMLAPAYPPVWLAKATASLAVMSDGRLTLGLAVGGRPDDYQAVGRPFHRRGALMDETLELLQRSWAGEPVAGGTFSVGPAPPDGRIPVLIGGNSDAAVTRVARHGDGWVAGAGAPGQAGPMIEKVRAAWQDAGRDGEPRFAGTMYFGLGDDAASRASLRHYYGHGDWVDAIVEGVERSADRLSPLVRSFADAGITQVAFFPTVASLEQVDRLADAVL
jgi:alkanesulfonate monooxygenase SsuD/methylene tetrahydromethanopterin reductase-like flavin-dependent oxidoreductase (luciferase family)